MDIVHYQPQQEEALFALLMREGEAWADYWGTAGRENYRRALAESTVYVALAQGVLCGYVRCREDSGFGVYIYDLLVDKAFRGRAYGRQLMQAVCAAFPQQTVYVMSDVDAYYQKQGFAREGSIFIVDF